MKRQASLLGLVALVALVSCKVEDPFIPTPTNMAGAYSAREFVMADSQAVHDWLAVSRHAPRIAAVRAAHGRHGGGGSLYIILRRR